VTGSRPEGDRLFPLRLRGPRLAVALLVSVVVVGTSGYVVIEGWSAWDAFYMTITTVSTVGYRELHELSRAGQVFTSGLIIMGVGTAFYTFSLLIAALVDGSLHRRLEKRRRARMLDDLKDHVIVCGCGRIGSIIAEQFDRERVPYVVIDRDPERVHAVLERGGLAVAADASREEVLQRVGIARARALIAAVGSDAENVYAILSARGLRPICSSSAAPTPGTPAGSCSGPAPAASSRVDRRHADCPERPSARPSWTSRAGDRSEPRVSQWSRCDRRRVVAGRTGIVDANLRQRFGVIVVGIQHALGRMEFNPPPDGTMRGGDQLVVRGRPESLRELEAAAQ
jgi:voltage-gated potassium channel